MLISIQFTWYKTYFFISFPWLDVFEIAALESGALKVWYFCFSISASACHVSLNWFDRGQAERSPKERERVMHHVILSGALLLELTITYWHSDNLSFLALTPTDDHFICFYVIDIWNYPFILIIFNYDTNEIKINLVYIHYH